MDISHITSQSLLRLLNLTEQKDELIKLIEEVETEIARTLRGAGSSVLTVVEVVAPTKPKTPAPAKPVAKAPKKAKAGRSGGLKNQILSLLAEAGSKGLRVKEIAEKLGSRSANISVWFSTTGKKLTTKVEPGRYALKGSPAKQIVAEPTQVEAPAKPVKGKKGKMSPAGRARISAAAKARWAALRAGKTAPVAAAGKPAKAKNNLTSEGRAKLAASMKARWAARKAAKSSSSTKAAKTAKA